MEDLSNNCILNIEDAVKAHKASNKPCIIVTGVTGQDGSYMVEYLQENFPNEYFILGGTRRLSVFNSENCALLHGTKDFHFVNFDLHDAHGISQLIQRTQPAFFINFAAQSFVACSWDLPAQTWEANSTSILHILEAVRRHSPSTRVYQAGSSEEFGNVSYSPQDEIHPLKPRSPYGASKAASRMMVKVMRESYNIYAVQGFLFNHESERRGGEFVTRKISLAVARIRQAILKGIDFETLQLGNIDSKRDWSHAQDMVDGVWRQLNQDKYNKNWQGQVKEYVLGSKQTQDIRSFVSKAFKVAGFDGKWVNATPEVPENEKYVVSHNDQEIVVMEINKKFYRHAEVELLYGDNSLACKELEWKPKNSFDDLVRRMVENDIRRLATKSC